MIAYHFQRRIDAPAIDVPAMLRARPATWLQSFLDLAMCTAGAVRPEPGGPKGFYRLRSAIDSPVGRSAAAFVWRPRIASPSIFASFEGHFEVINQGHGIVLMMTGHTGGGAVGTNITVLDSLVHLIASAVAGVQRADG